MRSTASIKGHPIHPGLVVFPFAFLTGAFFAHVVAVLLDRDAFWLVGGYLTGAGLITGVIAAVPGFLDYLFTVPPRSSGKSRATKHLFAMATVLVAFAVSLAFRDSPNRIAPALVLILQGAATGLLFVGAWMGGTLMTRNQIGVDHRYARAGKWSEVSVHGARGGTVVGARSDELEVDQMKLLRVDGQRIVLARTESGYTAFDDRCPHRGGSLAGGVMICGVVQCPWHGSQFDTHNGSVRAGPAMGGIRTYPVEDNGRELLVRLSGQVDATPNADVAAAPGPAVR
jgi:nitrite reductase/ring-hydroxylating ferredoxin subunit/uncharacterized membrane protein